MSKGYKQKQESKLKIGRNNPDGKKWANEKKQRITIDAETPLNHTKILWKHKIRNHNVYTKNL